eukprot:gene8226-9673_t
MYGTRYEYLPGSLPLLTHLTLGGIKDHLNPGALPQTITHLALGSSIDHDPFNQVLERNVIPPLTTHLFLGGSFNQVILPDTLPPTLVHMVFGSYYNQPIHTNVLPTSLATLGFGVHKQVLVGIDLYDYSEADDYDIDITRGSSFNQQILPGVLPQSLTSLSFGSIFNKRFLLDSPPSSLLSLSLNYAFNQPIDPGVLPQSLTYLDFDIAWSLFNQPLGVLPPTLTHLGLGKSFNQPLDTLSLPNTLQHITLGKEFKQSLFPLHSLPSLTHLTIDNPHPTLPLQLPPSVTHLTMGHLFDSTLRPGSIPNTVTHLTFGFQFGSHSTLLPGSIPTTITHLSFGEKFKQNLSPQLIPSSVRHLTLPASYMCDRTARYPQTSQYDNPDEYQVILNKSTSIPSVTHLTFLSMQGYISQYPFPAKLLDQLLSCQSIVYRLITPFSHFPNTASSSRTLSLRKIDKSTVVWVDQQPE